MSGAAGPARAGWPDLAWLAPALLAPAAVFAPFLLGDATAMRRDIGVFYLPQLELMAGALRNGSLPLWSPWLGAGGPLVGDASFPLFYPLHAVLLLLSPVTALNALLIAHLQIAGAGVYALARALSLSRPAAALAGLSFAAGGTALSATATPMFAGGTAWLPWCAFGLRQALRPGRAPARRVLAALPFALTFLMGALEYCALGALLAWALAAADTGRPLRAGLELLVAGLVAAGLCGLALLPLLLHLPETARSSGLALAEAGGWSMSPLELVGLLIPRGLASSFARPYSANPWHRSVYLGALPFACAGIALARTRRDARVRAVLALALALLPVAFGSYAPVYPWLHEHLPPLRGMRYPAKLFAPVACGLALLAGIGLDRVLERRARGDDRGPLLAVAAAAAASGLAALAGALAGIGILTERALLPLLAAALGGIWLWRGPRGLLVAGWLALTWIDLLVGGSRVLEFAPRRFFERPPALLEPLRELTAGHSEPVRLGYLPSVPVTSRRFPHTELRRGSRIDISLRDALFPNANLPRGIGAVPPFSPLRSHRWERLWDLLEREDVDPVRRHRLWGATHLVYTERDAAPPGELVEQLRLGPWRVGALVGAPPWAALYAAARPASGPDEARRALLDPDFDPRGAVVVEGAPAPPPASRGAARPGAVRLRVFAPDRLEFQLFSEGPAWFVLREAWAPGWRASLDAAPTPVRPADALFRAVAVPPGEHRLVLRYTAPGWRAGLGLSALTAAGALAALLAARRRPGGSDASTGISGSRHK